MSYIENKLINILITFIILLIIVFILLYFFNYQPYVLKYGEVKEDYVDVYLTDEEISSLNYKLKYDGNIYDYEILEVASNYIFHENSLKRNVKIIFPYDRNQYILELYFGIGEETNIWDNLYKKYLKGVI